MYINFAHNNVPSGSFATQPQMKQLLHFYMDKFILDNLCIRVGYVTGALN